MTPLLKEVLLKAIKTTSYWLLKNPSRYSIFIASPLGFFLSFIFGMVTSRTPFLYFVLASFGLIFVGNGISLRYLRLGVSTEMVSVSSVPWSLMSSFSTPGNSAITFISPLASTMSIRGSRSSFMSRLGLVSPKASGLSEGFTFPNSLIFGFPSGPMVMEYP